jgi:hypothetical protein
MGMFPPVCVVVSHAPGVADRTRADVPITAQRALTPMSADVLYSDSLVEISAETILFRRYYFPFGAKRLKLSDIERIVVQKPSFFTGKFRLQGSAGLHTWSPMDLQRPRRRKIFFIRLRSQKLRISFTVENDAAVEHILREKNLLQGISEGPKN